VQMALRQLGRPGADLANVAADLRRVDAQTTRMSLLLGTLSDVTRLTLGQLVPRLVDADLGMIIRDYLDRIGRETADRVQVETTSGVTLTGLWDPELLQRVIANILSNALKFSQPHQPVQVSFAADSESVTLSVTDHGIGLSTNELPCLFSRYGRAGGALAAGVEGSGLGLFLSKGIVEAHGGQIWAESSGVGLGMTVTIVLPRL
jgi:signal transduction histidine kinase